MSKLDLSQYHFAHKRILALDYGEKIIGTAFFHVNRDPYPLPYERILNQDLEKSIDLIKAIVSDESVDFLVVGVPYLLDGQSTPNTLRIQSFIIKLRNSLPCTPCFEQDETLSTYEAEKRMRESAAYNFKVDLKKIDSVSASIILEDFLSTLPRTSLQ